MKTLAAGRMWRAFPSRSTFRPQNAAMIERVVVTTSKKTSQANKALYQAKDDNKFFSASYAPPAGKSTRRVQLSVRDSRVGGQYK